MKAFRILRSAFREQGGFTLAEILIVIVIIGILAAFVMPKLLGKADEARVTASKAQITSLVSALRAYNIDHGGKFPTTDQGLEVLLQKDEKGKGPYLENAIKLPRDSWDNDYRYLIPGQTCPDYDLWSMGPDGISNTDDDIRNCQ